MFSLPRVDSLQVSYQEKEVQKKKKIPGLLLRTSVQNTAGNVGTGGKAK